MRVKIANPWIPVSFGLVLSILLVTLKILGIFKEDSGIVDSILIIAGSLLGFIYFPWLTVAVIRKNDPRKKEIISCLGLFCIVLWVLGYVCILYKLPFRAAFLVYGAFYFMFNFIPAWYALKFRKDDLKMNFFFFFLGLFYFSLMLHAISKVMHYPFQEAAGIFCTILFCGLVAPCGLYLLYRKDLVFDFKEQFIFIFLLGYIISNVQDTKIRVKQFTSISTSQELVEKNYKLYKNKNNFIYDAFLKTEESDTSFIRLQQNALKLRALADSMDSYVHHIKARLIAETDGVPISVADTMTFEQISSKSNGDIPAKVLFGPDFDHITEDEYSARDLKKKLRKYPEDIVSLLAPASLTQFKQNNPIAVDDKKELVDGLEQSWEFVTLLHKPLGMLFTQLTSLQADIRYAEMVALNELFNTANAGRKFNMAAQLSELASKYEAEKRDKKIALLEKDKELNDSRLKAKDAAISQKEQTIVYFITALILFIVLIIFVVRANLLRRKANELLTLQKETIFNQKNEVEKQKHLLEEKNKEITDSINYAKRLQEAILPPLEFVTEYFPESFIYYQPKDIVAGDFYWAEYIHDRFYIAAADSTGHGVPGAMVSVVCSNALNRTVKEFNITETGEILDQARELVLETFEKSISEVKDGMDISLLCIDVKQNRISWSGANNPLWFVSEGIFNELKGDKQPIGKSDNPKPFTTHEIAYKKGTIFYLFTDGLADQFGGPNGKKYKYKQFADQLTALSSRKMNDQEKIINISFQEWKGELEQVDDVCVIGIRI